MKISRTRSTTLSVICSFDPCTDLCMILGQRKLFLATVTPLSNSSPTEMSTSSGTSTADGKVFAVRKPWKRGLLVPRDIHSGMAHPAPSQAGHTNTICSFTESRYSPVFNQTVPRSPMLPSLFTLQLTPRSSSPSHRTKTESSCGAPTKPYDDVDYGRAEAHYTCLDRFSGAHTHPPARMSDKSLRPLSEGALDDSDSWQMKAFLTTTRVRGIISSCACPAEAEPEEDAEFRCWAGGAWQVLPFVDRMHPNVFISTSGQQEMSADRGGYPRRAVTIVHCTAGFIRHHSFFDVDTIYLL